jgi:hypothetical protein
MRFVIRLNSGGFKAGNRYVKTVSINGMPDVLFIYRGGLFIGIEVKTEKGKLSEPQIKFQEASKTRRVPYLVVRSAEEALFEVEKILGASSGLRRSKAE